MRRHELSNLIADSHINGAATANSQPIRSAPSQPNNQQSKLTTEKSHLASRDRLPLHPAIRFEVRMRAGGRCTHRLSDGSLCNSSGDLEIHHIIEVANGGTDDIANLQLLCRKHHQEQHSRYDFDSRPAYRSWVRAPHSEYSA